MSSITQDEERGQAGIIALAPGISARVTISALATLSPMQTARAYSERRPARRCVFARYVRHAPFASSMFRLQFWTIISCLLLAQSACAPGVAASAEEGATRVAARTATPGGAKYLTGTGRADGRTLSARKPVPFRVIEKVGWYQFDDGSRMWMTWSTDGGLTLHDLERLRAFHLRTVSDDLFTARDGRGQEYEMQFRRNGAGEVVGFRWLDADGNERSARRIADAPYVQEEVGVQNGTIQLVGLLLIPAQAGPHPGVILVSGGSESARDDTWYLFQADHLARRGIAVFLPDSRGSGKSGGQWETASFRDLADDVVAAARHLSRDDRIDARRIGIAGVGEGGWITPVAAASSGSIRFMVTVSAPATSPREQMRHDIASDVRRYGTPDFLVPLIAFALEFRSTNRDETWWEQNGRFDPIPYWQRLDKPALAIFGRPDQESAGLLRQSLDRLREARDESGNAEFTIRVIEDADQRMFDLESGKLHDEYLDLLVGWILTNAA